MNEESQNTSQRWLRAEELFHTALDKPAEQRAAFLSEACGDDRSLRDEIDRLLDSYGQAGGFLEPRRDDEGQDLAVSNYDAVGRQVGAYRLVDVIASGGMGSVYRAVRADEQYEKQVAVKLIKHGAVTEEMRRRFTRERQMLASLEHPYITRLLDGGATDDGLPYLVMDYVEGRPIIADCDARGLSINRRLELFRQVCSAVQYAHQNLIVHRDLKPGNILVTRDGEPRLLDFGISKLMDDSETESGLDVTVAGVRALTPQYASPEQIRGEPITTATDVYSLGVILYELLSGHKPYRLENEVQYEAERIVCEVEPPTPSSAVTRVAESRRPDGSCETITPEFVGRMRGEPPARIRRRLKHELDAIVLKAMHKQPQRRYASVEQLSEDIGHYLDGRPLTARKQTAGYRAAKFIRRNIVAVSAAAAVVLVLAASTVVATMGLAREATARERADIEAARATQINEFLNEMLASVDPGRDGREVLVVDVLERAAKRVITAFSEQPEIEGSLHGTIGVAYRELGLFDASAPHLVAALRLARGTYGRNDRRCSEAMNELALLRWAQGRMDQARPLLEEALAIQRELGEDDDPATLTLINNLAGLCLEQGRLAEAETLFRRTMEVQRRTLGDEHADTMLTMSNLALLLRQRNRLDEAEDLFRTVLEVRKRSAGDAHPDTIASMNNLAALLSSRGSNDEAAAMARQVLDLQRRVNGPRHPHTLIAMNNLGVLLCRTGALDEAASLLNETLSIRVEVLGAEHPETLATRHAIASVHHDQGRIGEALSIARGVLESAGRVLPESHWRIAFYRLHLAKLEIESNQLDGVEAELKSSFETLRDQLGPSHPHALDALATVVLYYETTSQPALAAKFRGLMPTPRDNSKQAPSSGHE